MLATEMHSQFTPFKLFPKSLFRHCHLPTILYSIVLYCNVS